MTDLIHRVFNITICPELASRITQHMDEVDYAMLYFTNKSLQNIIDSKLIINKKLIAFSAAENGYLSIFEWADDNNCPFIIHAGDNAVKNGHVHILAWLKNRGYSANYTYSATVHGRIDVLEWLKSNNTLEKSSDFWDFSGAVEKGDLSILVWAAANGMHIPSVGWTSTWLCTHAARHGHLKLLKWLRANDCAWNKVTCYQAIKYGHIEILIWARINGCPWDQQTIQLAAEYGYVEN
jgi:hypothetical protein